MELDELRNSWARHEKLLLERTDVNKILLRKLLLVHAEKRIDWMKIKSLTGLILPFILIVFIVLPRIRFSPGWEFVTGMALFVPIFVLTYAWSIRLYLQMEKLHPENPLTTVQKQLKAIERNKLRYKRYSLMLAPVMVIGIFLSAGIPFLSEKMILFYALMILVFLVSTYIQSKYGMVAQIRKIKRDMEEISKLELGDEKISA